MPRDRAQEQCGGEAARQVAQEALSRLWDPVGQQIVAGQRAGSLRDPVRSLEAEHIHERTMQSCSVAFVDHLRRRRFEMTLEIRCGEDVAAKL